ncbi:MAG: A/G-specific adenine glycosylase [Candidatus Eremiobacteraeota bacterium]|nr:A/G-specific adenine glycosylase [Candidatus Eremiobacteraeota bacterium]
MPGEALAEALLAWFARNGRSALPWRTQRDAYRVVVSEFMLQQTQVERVVPIFERFVAVWPTFAALAAGSQADVVRAWKGLGYNSRAVRLHRLARTVGERYAGVLPAAEVELLTLPGVGPYTARAIAAFAFDADVAAIDTNVRRIVHRTQLGIEWPPRATSARLDALASALVPRGRGFAFNSALMDLGATLCTARAPKCLLCPLQSSCAAAPIDAGELVRTAARNRGPSPTARVPFERTARFARGRVIDRLRALPAGQRISLLALGSELDTILPHHDRGALSRVVADLTRDGIVQQVDDGIALA